QPELAHLIGPEGGLSDNEITQANQAGFMIWCLGDSVLRTETSPVVALFILSWSDFIHIILLYID
ncbi:RsmE family RNA methyltransferase, partial [Acinetobacter baumannii]